MTQTKAQMTADLFLGARSFIKESVVICLICVICVP